METSQREDWKQRRQTQEKFREDDGDSPATEQLVSRTAALPNDLLITVGTV